MKKHGEIGVAYQVKSTGAKVYRIKGRGDDVLSVAYSTLPVEDYSLTYTKHSNYAIDIVGLLPTGNSLRYICPEDLRKIKSTSAA